MMGIDRSKTLVNISRSGPVVYWMSRDQRVYDNWALLEAQRQAITNKAPFYVVFILRKISKETYNPRHYQFMLKGLEQVENDLKCLNIPFHILLGQPEKLLPDFLKTNRVALLIKDFSPLKGSLDDNDNITRYCSENEIGFKLIDAHNVVPVWITSSKKEYAARFFKKRLEQLLPIYLVPYPNLESMNHASINNDWQGIYKAFNIDANLDDKDYPESGYDRGMELALNFIDERLPKYNDNRNDPNLNFQSGLSPYLHFGQISAQRVALETELRSNDVKNKEAFLDELLVWRELADNYCYYEKNYNNPEGFPNWAKITHRKHEYDPKEYSYHPDQFEKAQTHDQLWNAAQKHMIIEGKMPGYLRMYWAKKILEWSPNVVEAHKVAIRLNDKYSLDGRDPNGYAGIAWSIGGVHDRPWFERSVFGQIRYMSLNGCKAKFNISKYIDKYATKDI